MRRAWLLILLSCAFLLTWLGGCVPATVIPLAAGVDADIAIVQRSVVRLDQGQGYCRPVDPPVPPRPCRTPNLAEVDGRAHPEQVRGLPMQVAQGPHNLPAEQDQARLARWPVSLQ